MHEEVPCLIYLFSWFSIYGKREDPFGFPSRLKGSRAWGRGGQYLYSGLRELRPLCQLLPGVDIRVVGSLESAFQLFKLFCCERGSAPALFPLQGQIRFRVNVRAFVRLGC